MKKSKTVQARVTEQMKETISRIVESNGKTESDLINYCLVFTFANDNTIDGFCNTKSNHRITEPACQ